MDSRPIGCNVGPPQHRVLPLDLSIKGSMEAEGVTCMKVVSFKIEEDLLELLEEYSKKRNTTKSEIIRRALRSYIMRNSETPFETRRIRIVT
jgi:hypothetical protein